jgi:hypothetical protein
MGPILPNQSTVIRYSPKGAYLTGRWVGTILLLVSVLILGDDPDGIAESTTLDISTPTNPNKFIHRRIGLTLFPRTKSRENLQKIRKHVVRIWKAKTNQEPQGKLSHALCSRIIWAAEFLI